jgi:curved DNA-binding protein
MFAGQGGRARTASYKGQDFNAELHLELKEVYNPQRTLTINGKNIRLTIEAGVENGQVIKIHQVMEARVLEVKEFIHYLFC